MPRLTFKPPMRRQTARGRSQHKAAPFKPPMRRQTSTGYRSAVLFTFKPPMRRQTHPFRSSFDLQTFKPPVRRQMSDKKARELAALLQAACSAANLSSWRSSEYRILQAACAAANYVQGCLKLINEPSSRLCGGKPGGWPLPCPFSPSSRLYGGKLWG